MFLERFCSPRFMLLGSPQRFCFFLHLRWFLAACLTKLSLEGRFWSTESEDPGPLWPARMLRPPAALAALPRGWMLDSVASRCEITRQMASGRGYPVTDGKGQSWGHSQGMIKGLILWCISRCVCLKCLMASCIYICHFVSKPGRDVLGL